jgi:4-hydroxy-tetrahydrodipicolinate reductase
VVDVVVCGAAGRMGRMIVGLAAEAPDARVVGAIESPGHAAIGQDAGTLAGTEPIGVPVGDALATVCRPERIVIDFTVPAATLAHAKAAAAAGAGLVIGTTGF